jgi:hypothetical protein
MPIPRDRQRPINQDFAAEIRDRRERGPAPSQEVIRFRNDEVTGNERQVWNVPCSHLRFRKENGRIRSDVLSYEKQERGLNEEDVQAQETLRGFLEEKDPEKTRELVESISHTGQRDPAIITADGFLINGNRRKVALDQLYARDSLERYSFMKVVILPGHGDEGGPPTLKEIQKIENTYQLQTDGRSEYTLFDKALTMIGMERNIGISLKDQLKDDPTYAHLSPTDLERAVKRVEKETIHPVECIDRYLSELDRPGYYMSVSAHRGDREGRWQAFLDYSNVSRQLNDENSRLWSNRDAPLLIEPDEIGDVEEIAFQLIRKRSFPDQGKVHQIVRDLPKYLRNAESKAQLFNMLDRVEELSDEEKIDENGNEYSWSERDLRWGQKNATVIIGAMARAQQALAEAIEAEQPITLLEAALAKLNHRGMVPESVMGEENIEMAMQLADQIKSRADDLTTEFYQMNRNS